jgi:PhnB protein
MQLNPYLNFKGQCEAAFKFYEQCLGGKIMGMHTYAQTPLADKVPPDWRNKIIHASLVVGEKALMGSDAPPERYEQPKGFSVSLAYDNPAEAERVFRALSQNGTVQMPIQETFWALRFGMFVDQFGIPWMVSCEKPVKA